MTPRIITITEDWIITDGPNGEDLFLSLRKIKEQREVEFELLAWDSGDGHERAYPLGCRLKARIMQIAPEDGSGHSWCLKVRFLSNRRVTVTNRNSIDVYYHDGGNGNRRGGRVTDARPDEKRMRIERDGSIFDGSVKIGNISQLYNVIS